MMMAALVLAVIGTPAIAQSTVKIGFMTTLTGPQAVLGQHARDGFNLGLKHSGGKLGGLDAQVVIADDELKPDLAVTKIKGLIERDAVDFVTGIIFSNAASSGAAHRQRSSPIP